MADDLQVTPGPAGTGSAPSSLRVSLLGTMQVEFDGQSLHVAGPQRRRLLALLAMRAGRVVPIDALIDAMWGDDPPPSAAKTLQSHVVRLRQSLAAAGDPIETTPGGYRLDVDPDTIDATRFEQLASQGATELRLGHHAASAKLLTEAVGLWRGPALMEFSEADFATGVRTRLDEQKLDAVEDLAEARLGCGAASSAVADLQRVVSEHPGRERAWALLMRALYALGRQHDALEAFQRARTALGDEFGLEPGRELRDLERRIVEQDPTLDAPRERSVVPPALQARSPLVGRVHELSVLRAAWEQACVGVGQVRAVLGPDGSGRTRLVAELAAAVAVDGGSVEYVPGATGLHALANGPGLGAIIDAVSARSRVTPLLLVVDDVEWTPPESIEAIRALAGVAERLMLLMVLIGHDGDGPGIRLIHELEMTGSGTLALAPLADHELAELLTAEGVDPEAADVAVALAHGIPGTARREAAAWAERAATDRLQAAASVSIGAHSAAAKAGESVIEEVTRLVEARARRAALANAQWTGRQPYRSLASYEPADSDLFVGRERFVAELTARVLDRRVVAVVGASGSGKSSIVRAGLLPLVRSGHLPGGGAWRSRLIVPGRDPLAAIDAIDALDEPGRQLIVIDQFEEVLSTGQIDAVATRLLDLVLDPALDVRIVLVVRADQIGALASSRALAEMIDDNQMLVGPPTDEELRRIVIEPARRTGCEVDPELVGRIATDVAGYDAALPLVSAALAEVWERCDGKTLSAQTYDEIGGLAAAVERLGDRALAAVGPSGQRELRDVMLRLVDVTDDGAWVRRRVDLTELPSTSAQAIDALVDARLAHRSDGSLDVVHEVVFRAWPQMVTWLEEARSDITLERDLRAAARSWDADGRSEDDVLRGGRLHAASDWASRCDHVPAVVAELIAASRDWGERDNRAIREQLAREQRGRRRFRAALVAASLLLVIALIGGLLAVRNSRHADEQRELADAAAIQAAEAAEAADAAAEQAAKAAEEAEQRRAEAQTDRLVAESGSNLDRDLGLSMLLAVEAHRSDDTLATRGALLNTLTHNVSSVRATQQPCCSDAGVPHVKSSFLGFIEGPERITNNLRASGDGRIVATHGFVDDKDGGEVVVFDTTDRTVIGSVPTSAAFASSVQVSPDGSAVLIVEPTAIRIFDTATRELAERAISNPPGAEILGGWFTPDGSRVLVATDNHVLRVFDATTFDPLDITLPESPENTAGLAADGTLAFAGPGPVPSVTLWDLEANRELRTVMLEPVAEDVVPTYFAFSPDLAFLAGASFQGSVVVWDLADGHLVGDHVKRPGRVRAIEFDPNNPSVLAIGSAGGGVTMYDVVDDRPIGDPLRGLVGGVRALGFSGDGSLLVTTNDDGSLAMWTDNGGPSLLSSPIGDGQRLLGASETGDVIVVGGKLHADVYRSERLDDGPVRIRLRDQDGSQPADVNWVMWAVSADGTTLAVNMAEQDIIELRVFDTETGELRWSHSEEPDVYALGLSSDGNRLALMIDNGSVQIWDTHADQIVDTFHVEDAYPGAGAIFTGTPMFSADGTRLVVTTSTRGLLQFDTTTNAFQYGASISSQLQGPVAPIAGTELAVASGQLGRITQWDMSDGHVTATGRSTDPTSLNGATASSDGSLVAAPHPFTSAVALFDGRTLEPIGDPIPTGDVGEWAPLVVSPDGKRLYANGPLDSATEWNLDVDTWEAIACHAAGRNLTRDEWAEFLGDDTPYRATCAEWPPAS